MNIRESLANTILEISNSEGSDGGFFPFFITDNDGIESCVRRPLEKAISYVPRGGYDGSASSKFLIIGPPETGKTKEAIEIIHKLDRLRSRTIIYSLDSVQIPNQIPTALDKDASLVVFLDDFGRDCLHVQERPPILATRGGFPRPLQKLETLVSIFEGYFKDVTFIITINQEYYEALKKEDEGHNLLMQFKKIELKSFTPKQTERLIQTISKELNIETTEDDISRLLKFTYGSITGLAYFFHSLSVQGVTALTRDHIHNYYELFKSGWEIVLRQYTNEQKTILRALATLRQYLILPHKELVVDVAKELSRGFSFQKKKKIQEALDSMLDRVLFQNEDFILCSDSFLPENKLLPVPQLQKVVLDFAKRNKEGSRLRQSLLNFSDRLMDENRIDLNLQVNLRLTELMSNYPEVTYNLGVLRSLRKQTVEAERLFLNMLEERSSDPFSYYNYAVFLSDQGKIEEAHEQYLKALELAPKDADIHFKLAAVLMAQRKLNEAEAEFQRGIELNPFDASARNNYGVLLRSLNKISQAEHQYRQAINIDPTYARAYKNLGVLLFQNGRFVEAEKNYRKSIELDATDPMTHFNLGVLLKQVEKKDEAELEYRKAIELYPNYAKTYNNLGVLLFSQGRYEEAEELYKKAIEIDPDYKDAHYNLTLVYEKTGDAEKAIEHWEAITRG